jgi:peptidoglycan/LPS O-acetylase OafA/YrhL
MTPNYRSDIDGLRAVAVISVLFFHSGFSFFSGGYVGVDIFFVISGYLITTIIVREIANNDFSISRFYERRFRRILPPLVVVVAVSLIIGFFFLTPDGVVDLGKSAIATALFSSNMLFYFESGYFDGAAEMKPLLHTWSLAVEEQYYIFFPLLLILIAKIDTKHYLRWLLVLGGLSFVACVVLTSIKSSAAFYWIPTRAWELFIGSILALHIIPNPSKRLLREVYSILGVMMIAYSVFQYSSETSFPGAAALLPTIGTALIILAGTGGHSLVSMALSFRPVVFIGLISYSLYLWHWPVIVYTKIFFIKELTGPVILVMLTLIFILSIISWKYVESPFRRKVVLKEKHTLLSASAIVSVSLILSGFVFIKHAGHTDNLTNDITLNNNLKDFEWSHWGSCEKAVNRMKNRQNLCDIGIETKPVSFILWGDSHAKALASGIDLSTKNIGLRGKIATQSACPPLLSIERPNRKSCNEFNQKVLKFISITHEIDTVILAARWALSTKGTRYKQEQGSPVQLVDIKSVSSEDSSNVELFEIGLRRTIKELHRLGKKVILVNPVPEVGYNVPSAHLIASMTKQNINKLIAPTAKEYEKRTKEVVSIFREIKNQFPIEMVNPDIYLCDKGYCNVAIDGIPLYRDDDHLSTFGSKYISKAFDSVFNDTAMRVSSGVQLPK